VISAPFFFGGLHEILTPPVSGSIEVVGISTLAGEVAARIWRLGSEE
jgi:hypothetical protein